MLDQAGLGTCCNCKLWQLHLEFGFRQGSGAILIKLMEQLLHVFFVFRTLQVHDGRPKRDGQFVCGYRMFTCAGATYWTEMRSDRTTVANLLSD